MARRNHLRRAVLAALLTLGAGTAARAATLATQETLQAPWGKGRLERPEAGVVRIVCAGGERAVSAVAAGTLGVEPGQALTVAFEARGTVKLQGMYTFTQDGRDGRVDFLPPTALTGEWRAFSFDLSAPDKTERLAFHLFNWQAAGWFEIRGYRIASPLPPPAPPLALVDEEFARGAMKNDLQSDVDPAGWSYADRQGRVLPRVGGLSGAAPRSAPYALELPAAAVAAGFLHHRLALPEPRRPLTVRLFHRVDADYAGNVPLLLVRYFDSDGAPCGETAFPLDTARRDAWTASEHQVPVDAFPAQAARFQIGLFTRPEGTGTPAGAVRFDSLRVFAPPGAGGEARLRPDRFAGWYRLGETVVFRPEGRLPQDAVALRGQVHDADGAAAGAPVEVDAARLRTDGWAWTPTRPGFYRIAFTLRTPSGETPLAEEFIERAVRTNETGVFRLERPAVAVVEAADGEGAAALVGYQLDCSPGALRAYGDRQIRLAGLVNGRFGRFHVTWADLEPERGRYDWSFGDFYVDACVKAGLKPVVGVFGTPRWASSRPDDLRVLVHVRGYSAVAPKDWADWERFVAALVERYKDRVDTWEVWNEPHLPGYSCYWIDSPENFVELLRRAHTVIKRVQPESDVWVGGMGMGYLPFYEKITALGAGRYYDTLALHGHDAGPAPFFAVDRKYGAPGHPWVNSEWHASLLRFFDGSHRRGPAERNRRMVTALFRQIRDGAERIALFETANLVEQDSLELHTRGGAPMNHTSGLFRRKPFLQPELGAVVMHHLSTRLKGETAFLGAYRFGAFKAAAFRSDAGVTLAFWHDAAEALPPDDGLLPLLSRAMVTDWEGRSVDPTGFAARPDRMYFAVGAAAPAGTPDATALSPVRPKRALSGPSARYGDQPLFDADNRLLAAHPRWIADDWHGETLDPARPPAPRRNRFAVALLPDAFELVVETDDPAHHQDRTGHHLYRGDGIQFAVDCAGEGYPEDQMEFQAALGKAGPELFKSVAPAPGADLPVDWTAAGLPIAGWKARIAVVREGTTTRYLVRLPLAEFYPLNPRPGDPLRFSLLVNENDDAGRAGYFRWGDGIGAAKDPALFGTLDRGTP